MELRSVVKILDEEFQISAVREDWSYLFDRLFIQKSLSSFRTPQHNSGLMIANSQEVQKIYTAFSPSRYVLEEIHMKGIVNSLLVVKHPFDWNGTRNAPGFIPFTERDYQLMEGMGISIYSLDMPLDLKKNTALVSSAYACAKAFKVKVEEEFGSREDNPSLFVGIIGRVQEKTLPALVKRLNAVLDYRVKLHTVTNDIGRVALVPGQGFTPELVAEARERGATTYITGVITPTSSAYDKKNYARNFSQIQKLGLNVIGCSHYLTEKWVMQFSIPYFSGICKAEFIEDKEALNILE